LLQTLSAETASSVSQISGLLRSAFYRARLIPVIATDEFKPRRAGALLERVLGKSKGAQTACPCEAVCKSGCNSNLS